jgi:hypothetical protein
MVVVFEGLVHSAYGQLYVTSGRVEPALPDEAFVGQVNGLCGGAVGGTLFMVTGTHTGSIPVRVVVEDVAPPLGEWEEIVEVAFRPAGPRAALMGWASDPSVCFDLPAATYRVRWSASAMDAGRRQDVADEASPAPDRYELAFWPAPAAPDAIVRRTGQAAAYWHDVGFFRG